MRGKNVRRYTNKDYGMICEWYVARDLTPPPPESLSDLGYIVEERVAGWLYLTNSNVAMIEGVISDPHTLPSYRRMANKRLCSTLVDIAVSLGYTNIVAITSHPAIIEICETLGFNEMDKRAFILRESDMEEDISYDSGEKLDKE